MGLKKLAKNNVRAAWVVLTNGAFILLLLTAPIRAFHKAELIFKSAGSAPAPFSYWRELITSPESLVVVFVLTFGIVSELRQNLLGPVFNLGLYTWCVVENLVERAKVSSSAPAQDLLLGLVFVIIPLSVVLLVDLIFYAAALLGDKLIHRRTT
jgi:hypothetical protein